MAPSAPTPASPVPLRADLLTVKEVAVILDVHAQTVRRLIAERKLKAVRVGRLVKVRRVALAEYYRNNES